MIERIAELQWQAAMGLRREVAHTIVSLGLDISGIQTFRDLHAALDQFRPLGRSSPDRHHRAN